MKVVPLYTSQIESIMSQVVSLCIRATIRVYALLGKKFKSNFFLFRTESQIIRFHEDNQRSGEECQRIIVSKLYV